MSVEPENPPQVFADCVKSPELVPESARLEKVMVLPVVLAMVLVSPELVVPCGTVPYARDVGENVTLPETADVEKLMRSAPTLFASLLLSAVFHCQFCAPDIPI